MSAENGKKIGDNTSVGLFIPLPEELGNLFPNLGDNDKSDPHCTFLYVGDIPKNKEKKFIKVIKNTFSKFNKVVTGTLDYLEYFRNPKINESVAVLTVKFNEYLDELRNNLISELEDNGFKVQDRFPLIYRPHVTLQYFDSLDETYNGFIPKGSWSFSSIEVWGLSKLYEISLLNQVSKVAMRHETSVDLMRFLSNVSKKLGVSKDTYVVGGAVRNFLIKQPIKDIDVVIDPIRVGRNNASDWFARKLQKEIPVKTNLTTNQYGVAILTVKDDWFLDGSNLKGETIEIANARKESYGGVDGKGYKPHTVEPSTIEEDIVRREFNFNTLMWRLYDLASGPDKAEIIDITGCGKKDLEENIMRCPRHPDIVFSDDPSRMIRLIKFLIKYGFKVSPEVEKSVIKNKSKLKNIPSSHLGNMILELFDTGKVLNILQEMDKLGLLDVIKEIIQKDKSFRETLANWAERNPKLDIFFDLMDYEMPLGRKLQFLSKDQLVRLRSIISIMDDNEISRFISVLEQPGKLVDMRKIISTLGLKGSEIKSITNKIRSMLLENPSLISNSKKIENFLLNMKLAKSFTEDDLDKFLYQFVKAKNELIEKRFSYLESSSVKDLDLYADKFREKYLNQGYKVWLRNEWVRVVNSANNLIYAILDLKSVPRKEAKKLEIAVRFFKSVARFPNKFEGWFDKFLKNSSTLILASKTFDDKQEDSIDLFKIGNFEVHNTIGASDEELELIEKVISKAISLINKSGIPQIKKVLYGDVYVVGQLLKAKTLAWYSQSKDLVYIRLLKKANVDVVETLLHELGHRLYERFLTKDQLLIWNEWDLGIRYTHKKTEMPQVGDVLPFTLNKCKNPRLEKIDKSVYYFDVGKDKSVSVPFNLLYKWMSQATDELKFPTTYSKKDKEEHFCDALALYLLGKLSKEHEEGIKRVFGLSKTSSKIAKKRSDKEKGEIFTKWKKLVNMSKASLEAWSKNPERLKASLNRDEAESEGGIQSGYDSLHRIKRRVDKNKKDWTDKDYDNAAQENGFIQRMLGNNPGNPVKDSKKSKWEISLLNWGHNPALSSSPANGKLKTWRNKQSSIEKLSFKYIKKAAYFNIGDSILYGKYKNKKGILKGFGKDERGTPTVIIEPYPKGRKSDKIMSLFNIWKFQKEGSRYLESKYKNKRKVKNKEGDESIIYEYSEGQIKNRNKNKAEKIEKLRGNLYKLQDQIKKDLKSDNLKTKMTALVAGLINDTFERVGNNESAKNGHFGVTGWLKKHITFQDGKAKFKYVGKSGVSHEKETKDKDLIKVLKEAIKDKKENDAIFEFDDFQIDSKVVNEYLKPLNITAKDIRGLHANREVQKVLKSIRSKGGKLPEDKKERDQKLKKEFKEALEIAAKTVGHESTTLKNQYLVPGLEENYLRDGTINKNLAKQKK